ncbi:hypothetical protein [Gephyromycinifex aptenodytis]|uniref:hypothetical protein n=1 Tax=Gephyromycinifex aptenodytis TaxID=2716227 RepID=UPI001448023A|nr:hypothetical protein [Gephyromycinifex aptenodytis]
MQAITAHLATAQNTIRMIESAPPQIETRVERVEVPVPVVPRWVWTLITVLLALSALSALLLAWFLNERTDHTVTAGHELHDDERCSAGCSRARRRPDRPELTHPHRMP